MDIELQDLISRTRLAAECAEKSGFYETSEAMRAIVKMLAKSSEPTKSNPRLLHSAH